MEGFGRQRQVLLPRLFWFLARHATIAACPLNSPQTKENNPSGTQGYNCWRAVARQLSIIYNSEIWPKSVGCKIVDLRSRIPSIYPGACGFGDMHSRFLYIRDMLVNAHGNIDRNSSNSRNQE